MLWSTTSSVSKALLPNLEAMKIHYENPVHNFVVVYVKLRKRTGVVNVVLNVSSA